MPRFIDFDDLPIGRPDNRYKFICMNELDEITVGATAIHTFILNFKYSEKCNRCEIFYKQSVTDVAHFDTSATGQYLTIDETTQPGNTFITVTIPAAQTKANFVPGRETYAQMKLHMKNGTTIFGEVNRVIVRDTVEPSLETVTYQEATMEDLQPLVGATIDDLVSLL